MLQQMSFIKLHVPIPALNYIFLSNKDEHNERNAKRVIF